MIRLTAVAFLALLTACPLPARADAQRSEAERLFEQAQEHLAQGEHDRAVELFERSFLLSQEPLLIYDIAQAYRLKGDCVSALGQYRRYLRLTEKSSAESAVEQTRQLAIDRAIELDRKCGQSAESHLEQSLAVQPAAKAISLPEAGSARNRGSRIFAVPLVLAIVGGGSVTTGIYYLAVDGREQCTAGETPPCVFRRDTARLGWGIVAGGAALLAGAVTVAVWEFRATPTVAVAVGPTSLRLGGRF